MPPINFQRAEQFIAAIPRGRWTSYKEVAIAAGSPNGAQAVGQWLRRNGDKVPHVWRVLTVDGTVADGFVSAGPDIPDGEVQVREMLEQEACRSAAPSGVRRPISSFGPQTGGHRGRVDRLRLRGPGAPEASRRRASRSR